MVDSKSNRKPQQNNKTQKPQNNKGKSLKTNTKDGTIKLFGKKAIKGVGVTKLKSKLRSVTRLIQAMESGKVS